MRDEAVALKEIFIDAQERGVAALFDEAGDLLAARFREVGEVLGAEVGHVAQASGDGLGRGGPGSPRRLLEAA